MTSTSLRPSNFQQPPRDPTTAALLSVIPGLGQFYNGQKRKGALFLVVTAANLALLVILVATEPIVRGLVDFGLAFHMQPNRALVTTIMEAHLGSPVSFICLGLMLTFVAYAIRDAYDHAALLQRKRIYPEYIIEIPEAVSGSYLLHVALMVSFFILAFFFLVPLPPKPQVTDIEFIQNQPPTQKHITSQRKSEHNSENAGKHENKEVVAPSPAPKAPSKAQEQSKSKPTPAPTPQPHPQPQAHPAPTPQPRPQPQAHPAPTPSPHPVPAPHPSPSPSPRPSPSPSPTPSPTPSPIARPMLSPTPVARPSAHPSPSPSPSPVAIAHAGGPTAFAPAPRIGGSAFSAFAPSAAPSPISVGTGGGSSGHPVPVPVLGGGGGATSRGNAAAAGAPAPTRVSAGRGGGGGASGGPAIAVAPSVARPSGGGGGEGAQGNPDANSNPNGRPSVESQADVDFGPYMADLQRRIKRAWFPPKGNESKRVVVIFKVHRGGELSNLRLQTSSGVAIADQAALKAVENAAPFRPLPPGAPDDVDIQFTFDYNVFGGGGRGVFRQF